MNTERQAPILDSLKRKAAVRKKYDEKRSEVLFLLGIHIPKDWKEPELGPAIRAYITALIASQRRKSHRKHSVKKLLERATKALVVVDASAPSSKTPR